MRKVTLDETSLKANINELHSKGITGKGIKVAVLDTGASLHPMLEGRVLKRINLTDGDIYDSVNGHGSWVCSACAGNEVTPGGNTFSGVAPDAQLIVIKVLDDNGDGYTSTIIQGINHAISEGADIISMSLGADLDDMGTSPLSIAIDSATSQGVICVVAAGNERNPSTPATAKTAISVGSVNIDDELSWFSGVGPASKRPYPTVVFYGGDIVPDTTTMSEGLLGAYKDTYAYMTGTSMATPQVAGFIALLKQMNNGMNTSDVNNYFMSSSIDLGEKGTDDYYGYGRVMYNENTSPVVPSAVNWRLILMILAGATALYYIISMTHGERLV